MLANVLGINPGITAVIGSGGKTSLIRRLAEELCSEATVVICTTTHIMRPEDIPVYVAEMSACEEHMAEKVIDIPVNEEHLPDNKADIPVNKERVPEDKADMLMYKMDPAVQKLASFISANRGRPVCIGVTDPHNPEKLVLFPTEIIKRAVGKNAYILVEADGAKHMPMKAHNENEPVIPEGCDRVILVIGAEGFGKTIAEAVHRPELFAKLAGTDTDETVTPKLLSNVLKAERPKFGDCRLQVIVNRTGGTEDYGVDGIKDNDIRIAKEIAGLTRWEIYAGNAIKGMITDCRK